MTTLTIESAITNAERAKLEEAIQTVVDEKGLVKTGMVLKLTPVSLGSFLRGGELYAKSLLKLARFAKEGALAKRIEAFIKEQNAPPKRPRKAKVEATSKKKAGKKSVGKVKAAKKTAKPAKAKKAFKKGHKKNPVAPPAPTSDVLVGHDLDEAEEADGIFDETESELAEA